MFTSDEAAPEFVASVLAKRIAAGQYEPGSKLPSIRSLADELGVSIVTMRIALAFLEAALMVETIPRSGTIVRDVQHDGGVRTFGLLVHEPTDELLTWMKSWLSDIMTLLHMMMGRVARELAEAGDLSLVRDAVDDLARVVKEAPEDLEGAARGQLAIYRATLITTEHPAYVSIINECQAVMRAAPELQRIFMPAPQRVVTTWRAVLALLPELTESNINGILTPLVREGAERSMKAFDEWAEGVRARRALGS